MNKKKTGKKKLTLATETVKNLESGKLEDIRGGLCVETYPARSCPVSMYYSYCCA